MGLREDILNVDDLPTEKVPVPEWDVTVYVRSMTALERDMYEASLLENKDADMTERLWNMRAKLVVLCCVDEDNNRVFKDSDVKALGQKSSRAVSRVADAAQLLNALGDESIEEIAGNSNPSGSEDSISDCA